jgi:uncharacterized protein
MGALGLASGLHCVGMCGGIVTAFGVRGQSSNSARLLAFNAGRLSTYAGAGALAGALGGLGWYASGGQAALYALANVVLIFIGLHLAGVRRPMLWVERLGAPLWRRVQPHFTRTMQKRHLAGAYAAGLGWGALPCGLVYGALIAAAFAGSPARGAVAMLAFGLGTLPWLLAAGVLTARLRAYLGRRPVRLALGGTVLGFGAWGLAHAADLRQVFFCF